MVRVSTDPLRPTKPKLEERLVKRYVVLNANIVLLSRQKMTDTFRLGRAPVLFPIQRIHTEALTDHIPETFYDE